MNFVTKSLRVREHKHRTSYSVSLQTAEALRVNRVKANFNPDSEDELSFKPLFVASTAERAFFLPLNLSITPITCEIAK